MDPIDEPITIKTPRPPAHLSRAAKAWYREVCENFELDSHHIKILQAACEAWDQMQEARAILAEAGMVYANRFGEPRAHPSVAVQRDARVAFLRAVRELDLDGSAPETPRPPALASNR